MSDEPMTMDLDLDAQIFQELQEVPEQEVPLLKRGPSRPPRQQPAVSSTAEPQAPPAYRGRPAGYICHVCQDAIPVTEMLNLVISGMWSIQVPELPQLLRTIHLHRDTCADVYIHDWMRDKAMD